MVTKQHEDGSVTILPGTRLQGSEAILKPETTEVDDLGSGESTEELEILNTNNPTEEVE